MRRCSGRHAGCVQRHLEGNLGKRSTGSTSNWPQAVPDGADKFTVADAYLFTVLRWSGRVISTCRSGNIAAYMARVQARAEVAGAMKGRGDGCVAFALTGF